MPGASDRGGRGPKRAHPPQHPSGTKANFKSCPQRLGCPPRDRNPSQAFSLPRISQYRDIQAGSAAAGSLPQAASDGFKADTASQEQHSSGPHATPSPEGKALEGCTTREAPGSPPGTPPFLPSAYLPPELVSSSLSPQVRWTPLDLDLCLLLCYAVDTPRACGTVCEGTVPTTTRNAYDVCTETHLLSTASDSFIPRSYDRVTWQLPIRIRGHVSLCHKSEDRQTDYVTSNCQRNCPRRRR
jgi:hypothetical protein